MYGVGMFKEERKNQVVKLTDVRTPYAMQGMSLNAQQKEGTIKKPEIEVSTSYTATASTFFPFTLFHSIASAPIILKLAIATEM